MNKKLFILPLLAISIAGCRKTGETYAAGQYNSGIFDENYYTEWNGVEKIELGNIFEAPAFDYQIKNVYNNGLQYDFDVKNLIKEEDGFSYGYLSKLYDGRLRCDGLTTKSRVQVDGTGYATFFPKEYQSSDSIAFALRGGTTVDWPTDYRKTSAKVNLHFSFYKRIENTKIYDKFVLNFNNLEIPTDDNGRTLYVEMQLATYVNYMTGADAMSFTFDLCDPAEYGLIEITDKYRSDPKKEKEHFSIMLYEFLLPGSHWY